MSGIPAHELAVGIIVMVTVPGVLVEFVKVQAGIGLEVPEAGAPVMPDDETVDHE